MNRDAALLAIRLALAEQATWLQGIERSAARFRILSTWLLSKVDFWTCVVRTGCPKSNQLSALSTPTVIPHLTLIGRVLAQAQRPDDVMLAGGERSELVYAALAGLCPWIRTPHVILDAHWQKSGGVAGGLQRLLLRLAARLLKEVQPHSSEECQIYEEAFGINRTILRPVPWSTSMLGHEALALQPVQGAERFVLTGGHSFRDYDLFLRAAGELGVKVKVGIAKDAQSASFARLAERYPNVEVHSNWNNAEYIQQMAACTVFAMPIVQGLTRSTADQTILNAMYLGRTLVATSSIGSRIYVRDGVNGFLVQEPRVEAWQRSLQQALDLDVSAREAMGNRAMFDAKVHFNEHIRLGRTLDNIVAVLEPAHAVSWTDPGQAGPSALAPASGPAR